MRCPLGSWRTDLVGRIYVGYVDCAFTCGGGWAATGTS